MDNAAETIFDFATNTGELYRRHCLMGAKRASLEAWESHVRRAIIPRMVAESIMPRDEAATISGGDVSGAACRLRIYYIDHMIDMGAR